MAPLAPKRAAIGNSPDMRPASVPFVQFELSEFVGRRALMAATAETASAAGFRGNTINHISLYFSNLERSTDFYQRAFSCKVNKRCHGGGGETMHPFEIHRSVFHLQVHVIDIRAGQIAGILQRKIAGLEADERLAGSKLLNHRIEMLHRLSLGEEPVGTTISATNSKFVSIAAQRRLLV